MTSTTFTMSIDGSGVAHWARRMYNFGKMTDVGKYYPPNKRESQARKLLSGFIPPLTGKQKDAILVGDATLVGIAGEGHDGIKYVDERDDWSMCEIESAKNRILEEKNESMKEKNIEREELLQDEKYELETEKQKLRDSLGDVSYELLKLKEDLKRDEESDKQRIGELEGLIEKYEHRLDELKYNTENDYESEWETYEDKHDI